jgi:uncharacterized GH25 family protein
MDFSKIKNLVKQNGDKFIVMDNGEPEIVVMSFKEYEKLAGIKQETKDDWEFQDYQEEFADLDPRGLRANQLYQENWGYIEQSEDIAPALTESMGLPVRLEDIRLEDLPI